MPVSQKYIVVAFLITIVITGVAAIVPNHNGVHNTFTNLQVLPKDISDSALMLIMKKDFNKGLGVRCGFCHAENKDSTGLDFPSDAKPEKKIARAMMQDSNLFG